MFDNLYNRILCIIAQTTSDRLNCCWRIGKILCELDNQKGKSGIYKRLAFELRKNGKGFSERSLKDMWLFYNAYSNFNNENLRLTWSHYRILSQMKNVEKRNKLEKECLDNGYSSSWLAHYFEKSSGLNNEKSEILATAFFAANRRFLLEEKELLLTDVSERGICARLMLHLQREIDKSIFYKYYVDVEYNRNQGKVKTIMNNEMKIIPITCDLIVHSRGEVVEQDNLLAIEMKKVNATIEDKQKDKERLIALTKTSFDDIWSFDGKTLPEHVCGYLLGIYYEIDQYHNRICMEFYSEGVFLKKRYYTLEGNRLGHERLRAGLMY